MNPAEKRDFDRAALTWDASPMRMQLAAEVGAAMLARIELTPALRVLDFGCGTGLLSLPWVDRIGQLTGADTSAGMLAAFSEKIARHGLAGVSAVQLGDETVVPDGPYDLIVSSMTLHHVADIPALLRHLFAALAPGGRVALADLDPDDGLFHSDNTGVCHFGFAREQMRRWLAEAGFGEIGDATASTVRRATAAGERDFTIFVFTAKKP